MQILVVNDDGIDAEGIQRLAKMARKLGRVTVVAPDKQCSAMSHKITVRNRLEIKMITDYPVENVDAYSVSGSPADCVKVAILHIMKEKPDIVFSGINHGYNVGRDILYSGTVGAAMESISNGIPAIAFSCEMNNRYDVVEAEWENITREMIGKKIPGNAIWNVNFPGCSMEEYKGILWDRAIEQKQLYEDHYEIAEQTEHGFLLEACGEPVSEAEEGTDFRAVIGRYVSIGMVKSSILAP